ncbi:MAG: ATP-binding protein [Rhizomicrobium sp.]
MTALAPASSARAELRATPAFLALLAATMFLASWGCIVLVQPSGHVSTIWISNAILLAGLLRHGDRSWPEIAGIALFVDVAADILSGGALYGAVGISLVNVTEVLLVALPLRRLGFDRSFGRSEVLLCFYGLVILSSAAGAFAAAAIFHAMSGSPLLPAAATWFGADTLGMSLVAPFLICVRPKALAEMFGPEQRLLTAGLLAAVVAAGMVCYAFPRFPLSFLYVPVLLLLTFRRGFAGGALGLFLAVGLSFWQALGVHVPASLAAHSISERIAIVQLYYAVLGFTIILAGSALDERRKLERRLSLAVRRAQASREEALLAKEVAEKASHAKSSFLANMSHELRTPLNAVLGFSEIIAREMYGPAGNVRYRDYAALINGAGTHLLDLINDILDMSKIEAGKLELHRERLNTTLVVRECTELMAERAAAGDVVLDAESAALPVFVSADRRAVKQILLNLLSNAIKFTPAGGTVSVRVSDQGAMCHIAVCDTGVGIAADEIDRLGNPFVQLSNNSGNHPGTGLGLALVKGLAEMHGGGIRIESQLGQGTTVTVRLPMKAPVALAA